MSLLIALLGFTLGRTQTHAAAPKPPSDDFHPALEMQKIFDAFVGTWIVSESFEISASQQGKNRRGTASFRSGPGFSMIEDYKSDGSAGPLRFLALIWWDRQDKVYRFLTCANDDGCAVRGTSKWEGNAFVNSWQEETNGRIASFRDSFQDISHKGFRLVSEGSADGKMIWRVITKYERTEDLR
jgi:hypothetical protein